jgi:N4-gp56 family major capsid protein
VSVSGTAQYASTAVSTVTVAAGMYLTPSEVLEANATLKTNKAKGPLNGIWPVLIHPYTEYDLFQDPTFQTVMSYIKQEGPANPWISGYVGDAFGARFYVTPNAYVNSGAGAAAIDVYNSMVLGRDSFGVGGLAGMMPAVVQASPNDNNTFSKVQPIRLIDKPFGSGGTADPMNQRATLAWFTTFGVKVLDSTFMVRIEHATALG